MSVNIKQLVNQQRVILPNTDKVIAALSLPSDCTLNSVRLGVSVEGPAMANINTVAGFAIEGWIIPVEDPDLADSYQDIWDLLVPKDDDADVVDLDTQAVESTSFWEPGMPELESIFEVGAAPQKIYAKATWLTAAKAGASAVLIDTTFKWFPTAYEQVGAGSYHVKTPSVVLFGLGSPALTDTSATEQVAHSENEWSRTKYIGDILNQAMSRVLGLIESGSETPYQEALELVRKLVEPTLLEETANAFNPVGYWVHSEGNFNYTVPGTLGQTTLDSGRY